MIADLHQSCHIDSTFQTTRKPGQWVRYMLPVVEVVNTVDIFFLPPFSKDVHQTPPGCTVDFLLWLLVQSSAAKSSTKGKEAGEKEACRRQ